MVAECGVCRWWTIVKRFRCLCFLRGEAHGVCAAGLPLVGWLVPREMWMLFWSSVTRNQKAAFLHDTYSTLLILPCLSQSRGRSVFRCLDVPAPLTFLRNPHRRFNLPPSRPRRPAATRQQWRPRMMSAPRPGSPTRPRVGSPPRSSRRTSMATRSLSFSSWPMERYVLCSTTPTTVVDAARRRRQSKRHWLPSPRAKTQSCPR